MRIETKYFFGRTKVNAILFVIFSDLRPDNRATYMEDIKSETLVSTFLSGRQRKVITFNFNFLHAINQLITCHDM